MAATTSDILVATVLAPFVAAYRGSRSPFWRLCVLWCRVQGPRSRPRSRFCRRRSVWGVARSSAVGCGGGFRSEEHRCTQKCSSSTCGPQKEQPCTPRLRQRQRPNKKPARRRPPPPPRPKRRQHRWGKGTAPMAQAPAANPPSRKKQKQHKSRRLEQTPNCSRQEIVGCSRSRSAVCQRPRRGQSRNSEERLVAGGRLGILSRARGDESQLGGGSGASCRCRVGGPYCIAQGSTELLQRSERDYVAAMRARMVALANRKVLQAQKNMQTAVLD